MNTVTFVKVTDLTMLCPQNAIKTRMQPFVIHNLRPRAYACEVQMPIRERWV